LDASGPAPALAVALDELVLVVACCVEEQPRAEERGALPDRSHLVVVGAALVDERTEAEHAGAESPAPGDVGGIVFA
jgi:hypothetical protein